LTLLYFLTLASINLTLGRHQGRSELSENVKKKLTPGWHLKCQPNSRFPFGFLPF